MTKKYKPRRGEILGKDGSPIVGCRGCGFHLVTTARLQSCPRCSQLVCRVCAEDQPHKDGERVCELPEGQEPKLWGYQPGEAITPSFVVPCEDKPVHSSTTE